MGADPRATQYVPVTARSLARSRSVCVCVFCVYHSIRAQVTTTTIPDEIYERLAYLTLGDNSDSRVKHPD